MRNGVVLLASMVSLFAACTSTMPTAPASSQHGTSLAHAGQHASDGNGVGDVHSAAHGDKGYIDGWFNGEEVQLYYTKSFFCAEPPDSGADTGCELGAGAETPPRPGRIPVIYAIAAAGIQPALATLACAPGTVCLNHPAMIDASRVGGSATGAAVPHSHILSERGGGWFQTVNVRVRDLNVWNAIAAAKSLDTVRALQADPHIGVNGQRLISADTPTNIFFFIASWRLSREQ